MGILVTGATADVGSRLVTALLAHGHRVVAAADPALVRAGAYDSAGPDTTAYRELLETYARICRRWHAARGLRGIDVPIALTLMVRPT